MKRYKCFLTTEAKSDVTDAVAWYLAIDNKLATSFRRELRLVLETLATNPMMHTVRYGQVRIGVMHRFPYTVHYAFDQIANQVFVYGIYHEARNPDQWYERVDPSL